MSIQPGALTIIEEPRQFIVPLNCERSDGMPGRSRIVAISHSDSSRELTNPEASRERLGEVIARVHAGDEAAWKELCRQLAPVLRGVVAAYRQEWDVREDIEGEVYLTFHRLVHQFDPDRGVNLLTYLKRTLAPSIHSYVRQSRVVRNRELTFSTFDEDERGGGWMVFRRT